MDSLNVDTFGSNSITSSPSNISPKAKGISMAIPMSIVNWKLNLLMDTTVVFKLNNLQLDGIGFGYLKANMLHGENEANHKASNGSNSSDEA